MIGPSLDRATPVSEAGGLVALACAARGAEQVAATVAARRRRKGRTCNLVFFCHAPAPGGEGREVGAAALARALAEGASPTR